MVVAHNNRFDYTFLRHEFARIHTDFAAPSLCTVQLSRRLYPEFYKHSLDSIIERTGIQTTNRHRAMTDVAALCDYLELSLAEKNHQQWDEHVRVLMNPKMLPTWLPDSLAQQLYALPDSYGVLVWFDHFGKAKPLKHMNAHTVKPPPCCTAKNCRRTSKPQPPSVLFRQSDSSIHYGSKPRPCRNTN